MAIRDILIMRARGLFPKMADAYPYRNPNLTHKIAANPNLTHTNPNPNPQDGG